MAENINIGGRLHSTATGNVVAGANEIYDDTKGKKQSVVNAETDTALENRYTKSETYNKTELNNMITTPNQEFVTVTATDQTTAATDVLPATGSADTVYRVGSWNGTQYEEGVYSEYSWNGSTYIHLSTKTEVGEVYDISAAHATGGELATYDDLADALGTNGANIPQSLRKGGMSVKFVQSSDNKYVQYRFMLSGSFTDAQFTTETNWQGVDDEPTDGSGNLVKSGGVYAKLFPLETLINASENIITNAPIISTYEQISYANGNQVSMGNNGYKCSGFIDVSDIDALSYKMYTGYADVALIAAYDENQTYIQENSVASVADSNKEGKWIKGTTTKFIRFSIVQNKSFAYIGNQHDSLENDRVNYANEFASISTKFDNVKSSINELCVLKYGTNYQTLNADGSLNIAVGNPSTYVTGYIDISLIDFIKYSIYKTIFDNPQCVIAAYNENKEFISTNSIISSTSGRYEGVWEKGSTTKFIRIGFNQSENVTSSAIITGRVVKDIVSNNLGIVAFGDSLTEGAGSQIGAPTQRYYPFTEHLKTFIDAKRATPCNMVNAGVGGEASWNIGYRQGGLGVMVMPFTIPASATAVEVTLKGEYDDYSFYNSQWNLDSENAPHTSFAVTAASKVNPIKIAGIEGTLTISNGKYYFTRTTAGDAITLSVPVFLDTYASRAYKDYIQIIWVGTNDAPLINGQYIMQDGLNDRIKDMLALNDTKKYIILGLTDGSTASSVNRDISFIKAFGAHFLNIREYLAKYGITIANEQGAGIEITSDIQEHIDAGIIDSVLKIDGVHGNYYYYYAVAKAIYEKGVSLNYWD